MNKVDLVIKGGRIVRSDQVFTADIAIGDGKIVGIVDGSWSPPADEVIDASGKLAMIINGVMKERKVTSITR